MTLDRHRILELFQRGFVFSFMTFLIVILSACSTSDASPPQATFTSNPPTALPTNTQLVQPTPEATETTAPSPSPSETNTPEPTVAPTSEPSATPLPELINDEHGVPMLLVPAGEFIMGSDSDMAAAKPAHKVYLDAYYIDEFEVTNALYLECVEAGVCVAGGATRLRNPIFSEHPVMDVTWYMAHDYCEWRGARLPSEAEWEKAARGTDERRFPWGDDPVTCELARYGDCGWFTVPVGQHPKGVSPYGVHDMAGNAWEWTNDWYNEDYYSVSPYENPTGPDVETGWKSTRGGAWFYHADLQTSIWRNHAPIDVGYAYLGFRCALTP
jgi:formylglycine-generating enzyme required for sulfatase activity